MSPPKKVNFIVYGVPGIGKTSFSALTPNVLVLDTEGSSKHIEGLNRKDIKELREIDDVLFQLKKPENKIETVVIDSLDEMVNNFAKNEARAKGFVNKSGNLTLEGYGILRDRFMDLMRKFRDAGVNVCITCHAANEDVPGEGKMWRMKLPSDYAREVMAMMDAVGFLGWHTDNDGKKKRRLYLRPTSSFDAKARGNLDLTTGEHKDILPEFMDDATFGKVLKYYETNNAPSGATK